MIAKSLKFMRRSLQHKAPFFQSMLTTEMKEKEMKILKVEDFGPHVVEGMLKFIYTEEVNQNVAMDLYAIADKYDLKLLMEESEEIILNHIDRTNVIEAFLLSHKHNNKRLKRYAFSFIRGILPFEIKTFLIDEPEKLVPFVEEYLKFEAINGVEGKLNAVDLKEASNCYCGSNYRLSPYLIGGLCLRFNT